MSKVILKCIFINKCKFQIKGSILYFLLGQWKSCSISWKFHLDGLTLAKSSLVIPFHSVGIKCFMFLLMIVQGMSCSKNLSTLLTRKIHVHVVGFNMALNIVPAWINIAAKRAKMLSITLYNVSWQKLFQLLQWWQPH